jgi:hypothetical protein
MTADEYDRRFKQLMHLSKQLVYVDGPGWAERYREAAESGDIYRALDILIDIHRRVIQMLDGRHQLN